jgi:mono/diheme cytochrome c family protein
MMQESLTRRSLLKVAGCGFGDTALSALLVEPARADNPLAVKASHLQTRANGTRGYFLHTLIVFWFGSLWLTTACCSTAVASEPVDFRKQIAPIFEQRCIRCHSPANRKGDVSLATIDDLKSNEYVIAGDPDGSYLIELVTSPAGEPPAMPKMSPALSDADVTLLRQWVEQGASWPAAVVVKERAKADASWWAFQPLRRLSDTPVGKSPEVSIDDFILEALSKNHLTWSPEADRRTLIRRLTFDLHGLPPTPEAVEAFVSDSDPRAYETLVDQLLESPRYGERFAQHWLDIAHYADTHGFERDQRRDNAWRYRDYVIRAFNEDKPYDRFLLEQIAGDVLWPDDEQSVIATGFLSAGPWDFVGQVETKSPELRRSARALDLDDMVTQVMTATMGLTVNCARCHDHKLDPITQQEYYQLQAVFAGVKREDRVVSDAALKAYEERKRVLVAQRNAIEFEIGRLEGTGLNLADIVGGGNGLGTGTYRNAIDPRNSKVQVRDFGKLGNVVTNNFSPSEFEFVDGVFIPNGENGQAKITVSSTGLTVTGLPTTSGDAWDMIRNGPVASQHSPELGGIDFTQDGHSLLGLHANAGITFDVAAMRKALIGQGPVATTQESGDDSQPQQPELRFTARVGYFGASGGPFADAWVFVDGTRVAPFPKLRREDGLQTIDVMLPASAHFLTLISTDGGNGFSMDQIGFGDPQVKFATPAELTEADQCRLAELRRQRADVSAQLESLGPPPRFYGVVAEDAMPEVRLLTRGDPESPQSDPLRPAALSVLTMLPPELGSIDSSEAERRVALAHWITHPDNPLAPRVIVNRLWHWHFGRGIVDTPSDFGYGGGRPSHPELLDWLAGELIRQGWSLKEMHRLILNSRTYRQSSYPADEQGTTAAQNLDADNRLLWRQNPRRLEAESIRDAVLFVSGKLNLEQGGPGFEDFRYQEAYAPIYTYITADEPPLWRRSIYRYKVRTTPSRFLTTLDCPDPANLSPNRLTTTTPLQSLALYNNEFMLRQTQYLSDRILAEAGPEPDMQAVLAFELAFVRRPSDQELQLTVDLIHQQGLFAVCRSLLNSNEFVYVD